VILFSTVACRRRSGGPRQRDASNWGWRVVVVGQGVGESVDVDEQLPATIDDSACRGFATTGPAGLDLVYRWCSLRAAPSIKRCWDRSET